MAGTVWTEGVCGDGAAILRDGRLVAISDVLRTLNDRERLVAEILRLRAELKGVKSYYERLLNETDDVR